MNQPATQALEQQTYLSTGTVLAEIDGLFRVRTVTGDFTVEPAFSCLVRPCSGDQVLVAWSRENTGHILAITHRPEAERTGMELRLTGPSDLCSTSGDLSISSAGKLRLTSREKIACASPRISVHADRGLAKITRFSFVGRLFKSSVCRLRTLAVDADQIVRRLTQRLGTSYRYVEEEDEIQARSRRVLVEDLLTLHSRNTLVMSEEHVTVNAEQIHLG